MHLVSICNGGGALATPIDWQRDGGAKHIIGIVQPLGFDEPFSVATKALRCTLYIAPGEHIRISTRKRHGIEGRQSGSPPPPLSWVPRLAPPLPRRSAA